AEGVGSPRNDELLGGRGSGFQFLGSLDWNRFVRRAVHDEPGHLHLPRGGESIEFVTVLLEVVEDVTIEGQCRPGPLVGDRRPAGASGLVGERREHPSKSRHPAHVTNARTPGSAAVWSSAIPPPSECPNSPIAGGTRRIAPLR